MDEEQLATLRTWADGLARDVRPEVAAAGKAIVMLVDDVEELHVELWNVRHELEQALRDVEAGGQPADELQEPVTEALRRRLLRLVRRRERPET